MENQKKKKWELKYEEYSNSTELETKLAELQDKIDNKKASREDLDEHKKLSAIKGNLPKVKNILEFREKLSVEKEEIDAELQRREELKKEDDNCQKLEEEMAELEAAYDDIQKDIKRINGELSAEGLSPEEQKRLQDEKNGLESKLKDNESKRQENNKKFADSQEKLAKGRENEDKNKFKDVSVEDLKNQSTQISMNMSKCNIACNRLMKGYSWQSVEVALDKFDEQRFIAKGKEAKKMQQNRNAAKAENAKEEQEVEQPATEQTETEQTSEKAQAENEQEENTSLAVQEDEKTLLAKIIVILKKIADKIRGKSNETVEEEVESEENSFSKMKKGVKTMWEKAKAWVTGKDEVSEETEKPAEEAEKPAEEAEKPAEETEKPAEEAEKPAEEAEKPAEETEKPAESNNKQDAFRQYLREVAEKGIDGVEQERQQAELAEKQARREAAKQKLEANRAEALKREAARDQQSGDER